MSCNCGENNCNKNSRREFLLTGLLATAAIAGCSDKKNPFMPEDDQIQPSGEMVKLFFRDNGIGIDAADYGKIFRMFERVGTPSIYDGTGIGLAIVAKAVERMGGKVSVESRVGEGSAFCVELAAA